jgi:hypothetical protein
LKGTINVASSPAGLCGQLWLLRELIVANGQNDRDERIFRSLLIGIMQLGVSHASMKPCSGGASSPVQRLNRSRSSSPKGKPNSAERNTRQAAQVAGFLNQGPNSAG